jgi:hypothetical protein
VSDPLSYVAAGDPIPNDAETWNAMIAAGRAARGGRFGILGGAGAGAGGTVPAVTVFVRNDTGGDLDERSVVALGEPAVSAVDYPLEVAAQPVFPGTAPAGATAPFAVLLGPIPEDEIGPAVLLGACVCDVAVADAAHTRAAPAAGVTATLASGTAGAARIVWKEAGTGTKRALVVLLGSAGTDRPLGGAGSGTDNRITRWDGTDDVQDSAALLTDAGHIFTTGWVGSGSNTSPLSADTILLGGGTVNFPGTASLGGLGLTLDNGDSPPPMFCYLEFSDGGVGAGWHSTVPIIPTAFGLPVAGDHNNVVYGTDATFAGLTFYGGLLTDGSYTGALADGDYGSVTVSGSGTAITIDSGAVSNAMLAGSIASSKLVGTDIDTVGTITTGTWDDGTW